MLLQPLVSWWFFCYSNWWDFGYQFKFSNFTTIIIHHRIPVKNEEAPKNIIIQFPPHKYSKHTLHSPNNYSPKMKKYSANLQFTFFSNFDSQIYTHEQLEWSTFGSEVTFSFINSFNCENFISFLWFFSGLVVIRNENWIFMGGNGSYKGKHQNILLWFL